MSEDSPTFEVDRAVAASSRYAVIAARFNEEVVARLVEGALAAFRDGGVPDGNVEIVWTPGAFELPLAAKLAAQSRRFDAIVCLGAVIRGETAHFEYVAGEAARGIREVGLEAGLPVIFGVLTTENVAQALDRAGGSHGDKGRDSALAAMQMVKVLDQLGPEGGERQ